MAWLSQEWGYRYPFIVAIDSNFVVLPAGNVQRTLHIPSEWAYFWENILPGGADVRITDWTGKVLLDFQFLGSVPLVPGGAINIDFANVTDVGDFLDEPAGNTSPDLMVCWLYWGNPSAAPATSVVVPGTVVTIDVSDPALYADYTVKCENTAPGTTAVTQVITKPPPSAVNPLGYGGVAVNVYWNVTDVIGSAYWANPETRPLVDQEIMKFCGWVVLDSAPAIPLAGTGLWPDVTMVMDPSGQVFLKVPYNGGTSGDTYHLDLQMQTRRTLNDTTDHRDPRARVNLEVIEPT